MENGIRVGSESPVYAVAGAIAGTYRDHGEVQVQAIGAGAVNQAIKAIIYAKEYLAEEGKSVVFTPNFVNLELNGRDLTGIRLFVYANPEAPSPVDEVMPVDTGEREGAAYLLKEETAVDFTAVPANADAITDKIDSYTTDEEIQQEFEERQNMAPSGRAKLIEQLEEHNSESPTLSGGDIDARWDQAGVGSETVSGTAPTPDQDLVDEIGEAMGVTYEDNEPLDPEKVSKRDERRWELDPDSAESENVEE
jgi:stage V sporulation protein SpoVS